MSSFASDSILVLLDVTPAGELAKSSAGLLGAAAAVGTPVALVVSSDEASPALAQAAADAGAATVLTAGTRPSELFTPTVDAELFTTLSLRSFPTAEFQSLPAVRFTFSLPAVSSNWNSLNTAPPGLDIDFMVVTVAAPLPSAAPGCTPL